MNNEQFESMLQILNDAQETQRQIQEYLNLMVNKIDEKKCHEIDSLFHELKKEPSYYKTCSRTILFRLLAEGNVDAIKHGFENHWFDSIDWNDRISQETKATPLYYILCDQYKESVEIAKYLIEKGASINNLVYPNENKKIKNYFNSDYKLFDNFTFSDLVQFENSFKEQIKLEKKLNNQKISSIPQKNKIKL